MTFSLAGYLWKRRQWEVWLDFSTSHQTISSRRNSTEIHIQAAISLRNRPYHGHVKVILWPTRARREIRGLFLMTAEVFMLMYSFFLIVVNTRAVFITILSQHNTQVFRYYRPIFIFGSIQSIGLFIHSSYFAKPLTYCKIVLKQFYSAQPTLRFYFLTCIQYI